VRQKEVIFWPNFMTRRRKRRRKERLVTAVGIELETISILITRSMEQICKIL